jgi:hypothetical protein
LQGEGPYLPRDLIGRVPDPELDRVALLRVADGGPALDELATQLHDDMNWKQVPLAALLPRIETFGASGRPFPPSIHTRAATCLMRGRISDWSTLAARTPAELGGLPRAGRFTVEEILSAAIREWARFHLQDTPDGTGPIEIYEGLLTLSAWGASSRGTDDTVAAVVAAAEAPEGLPPQVARVLRALRRIRPSEEESRQSLEQAFVELEATPGYKVFERRELGEGAERPTQAELAAELGLSTSRPGQMEAVVRRRLEEQMRDPASPLRLAAEHLREKLGAVGRLEELDDAFANLDPGPSLKANGDPHRRKLILHLCDYRVDGEWILGPDVERLTDIILEGVANGVETDLDTACRHLARLGVREKVQLQWILSRVGFRIIDEQVVAI